WEGLRQAFQNTWFASESYLLLPRVPRCSDLKKEAARFGVGVAEQNKPLYRSGVRPRRQHIPLSYASWLFNEWAWRVGNLDPAPGEDAPCRLILRGCKGNSPPSPGSLRSGRVAR